jgi:hypothetical protein
MNPLVALLNKNGVLVHSSQNLWYPPIPDNPSADKTYSQLISLHLGSQRRKVYALHPR